MKSFNKGIGVHPNMGVAGEIKVWKTSRRELEKHSLTSSAQDVPSTHGLVCRNVYVLNIPLF